MKIGFTSVDMSRRKTPVLPAEYGGFVLTFEPERTRWIAEHLYSDINLSESFSSVDWAFDLRELVFLVLQHQPFAIGAFAMMEPMYGSGGSAKRKMRMCKPLLIFDQPVSATELGDLDLRSLISTPERMQRLDSTTWNTLIARSRDVLPTDAARVDLLIAKRTEQHYLPDDNNRVARLNEQRDGLGLALDIGNLDRAHVLKSMKVDGAEKAGSVLDLLDQTTIQERSLLEHDRRVFELLLEETPSQAAIFRDGSYRSVRVLVVDRTDLETVLGIDLVIYHACYDNYLLLQYKRMDKREDGWRYAIPPSSNLYGQLESMHAFRAAAARLSPSPPSLWNYRLNDEPFYFKFCQEFRPAARDDSLITGITLSADHLSQFLNLPTAAGKDGSRSVGYHNCPRYLNNTEFIQLARTGWIGAGSQSAELMKKVLEANKQGGRVAMLAVIDTPKDESAAGRRRRY
jgi:hypothetical protein